MKLAQLANGDVLEFPDSVDEHTIEKAVKHHLGVVPESPNPIPSINKITTVLKSLFKGQEKRLDYQNSQLKEAILSIAPKDYTEDFKSVAKAINDKTLTVAPDKNILYSLTQVTEAVKEQKFPETDVKGIEKRLDELSDKMDKLYNIMSAERTLIRDKKGCPVGIKIHA